jgi:hypothetical protein
LYKFSQRFLSFSRDFVYTPWSVNPFLVKRKIWDKGKRGKGRGGGGGGEGGVGEGELPISFLIQISVRLHRSEN